MYAIWNTCGSVCQRVISSSQFGCLKENTTNMEGPCVGSRVESESRGTWGGAYLSSVIHTLPRFWLLVRVDSLPGLFLARSLCVL
jgi:hypothetical protein